MDDIDAAETAGLDVKLEAIFGRPMHFDIDGTPITWTEWMRLFSLGLDYKRVAFTRIRRIGKRRWTRCRVSTVWLGLDHGYGADPVIFETLIFGGPMDGCMWRYTSRQHAEDYHPKVVAMVAREIEERLYKPRRVKPARVEAPYKYRRTGRRHVFA